MSTSGSRRWLTPEERAYVIASRIINPAWRRTVQRGLEPHIRERRWPTVPTVEAVSRRYHRLLVARASRMAEERGE